MASSSSQKNPFSSELTNACKRGDIAGVKEQLLLDQVNDFNPRTDLKMDYVESAKIAIHEKNYEIIKLLLSQKVISYSDIAPDSKENDSKTIAKDKKPTTPSKIDFFLHILKLSYIDYKEPRPIIEKSIYKSAAEAGLTPSETIEVLYDAFEIAKKDKQLYALDPFIKYDLPRNNDKNKTINYVKLKDNLEEFNPNRSNPMKGVAADDDLEVIHNQRDRDRKMAQLSSHASLNVPSKELIVFYDSFFKAANERELLSPKHIEEQMLKRSLLFLKYIKPTDQKEYPANSSSYKKIKKILDKEITSYSFSTDTYSITEFGAAEKAITDADENYKEVIINILMFGKFDFPQPPEESPIYLAGVRLILSMPEFERSEIDEDNARKINSFAFRSATNAIIILSHDICTMEKFFKPADIFNLYVTWKNDPLFKAFVTMQSGEEINKHHSQFKLDIHSLNLHPSALLSEIINRDNTLVPNISGLTTILKEQEHSKKASGGDYKQFLNDNDPYKILGITPDQINENSRALKEAHNRMNRQNHPDRIPNLTSDQISQKTQQLELIKKAYDILKDPWTRKECDKILASKKPPAFTATPKK